MEQFRRSEPAGGGPSTTRRRLVAALAAGGGGALGLLGPTGSPATGTRAAGPTLAVAPATARYDERLDVRVEGVDPSATVTLTADATDRDGTTWAAFARFEATDDGTVDPASQAPVDGTYEGAHPMGLVWSMRPADGEASVFVPPRDGHELTVAARAGGSVVDERTVTRRFAPPDLAVEESPDGLVGTLYRPAGDGPFPGVVVLHGSGGRPDVGTAILLAAHGYAAFAPQYFGTPDPLPDLLAEVPVEYLDQARVWMAGLAAVRDGPVGLYGTSKGAEYALLGGATYDWVGAVVAVAPSGLVWAGLTQGQAEPTASWSVGGEPVDYLPTAFPASVVGDYLASWPLGEPVSLRPTYEVPLEDASAAELEGAAIPVERIDGPVTLLAGGDDALWPSVRMGRVAADRLRANDHPHAVRFRTFPQAGHGISYPYQPTTGLTSFPAFPPGTSLALGGTTAGLARAAREGWPDVLAALEEGLQ
jgi:dienelactone hydrolase